MNAKLIGLMSLLSLTACGAGGGLADAGESPDFTGCTRGELETDVKLLTPLQGSAIDAVTGQLKPGQYIVSTTYLQFKPDQATAARFQALMGPLLQRLATQDGLLAIQQGLSSKCLTARTLSVWRDQAAMVDFVTSSQHLNAMSAISELSRGGSAVTHWQTDEAGATWGRATTELGASTNTL